MKSAGEGRQSLKGLLADFISAVSGVSEVSCVVAKSDGPSVSIWTVLTKGDREAQQAVYEEEMKAMARQEELEFDFHTVVLHGRPVETVLPSDGRMVYSR